MGATPLIQHRTDVTLEEFYALQDKINTTGLVIDGEQIGNVEYYNGQVWFMAKGSRKHGIITGNVYHEARIALKGRKCHPYNGEFNFAIDAIKAILNPDMFISCGDLGNSEFDKNGVTNATVLIEVLSDSTERYDRSLKFRKYKQIPSFKEYILINQDKPLIETFVKHEGNLWSMNYYEGLEDFLHIQSVDVKIALADIYEGISFENLKEK